MLTMTVVGNPGFNKVVVLVPGEPEKVEADTVAILTSKQLNH